MVPLDQFEEEVIQRRPDLINNLARNYGDIGRGVMGDIQCVFAIRVRNDYTRLSVGVFGDALIQHVTMLHCPEDFESSRFESVHIAS
jgi:hypothetical protein